MVGRALVPQRGSGHENLARAGIFPQSARTAAHQKAAAPHGVQLFDGAGRARRRGEGHGHAHVASVPVHGQVQHFGVQLPDGPQPPLAHQLLQLCAEKGDNAFAEIP